jgi:hypothetical protein
VSLFDWFEIIFFTDQTNYKQVCGRYATRRTMSHVGSVLSDLAGADMKSSVLFRESNMLITPYTAIMSLTSISIDYLGDANR